MNCVFSGNNYKHTREILYSREITHCRRKSISNFEESFASIDKKCKFKEDWALGYNFKKFGHFLDIL